MVSEKTRVLLVDDHEMTRLGVRALLQEEDNCEVVGEATTCEEAVTAAKELLPDLTIMDINLPDLSGVEATKRIRDEVGHIPVLAFSMHTEQHYIREMFRAGVCGYITKDCESTELSAAIKTVISGERYLGKKLRKIALDDYLSQYSDNEGQKEELTYREFQVLKLTADGLAIKEIAYRLEKSPKTIEACRRRLMSKLDLHSVAELVKYALRQGITAL